MQGSVNSTHTEKELMYLKDQLGAEALTIKKLMDYKSSLDDPELSKMVDEMVSRHQDHYNRLLSHVK